MRQLVLSTLFLISSVFLLGCDSSSITHNQVALIQERGTLRVGTLYHPLYYFLREGQAEGLDFELAEQFAHFLDVELQMVPAFSLDELFALLDTGQVDMLAAGLTNTPQRRAHYRFSPSYYHITPTLVYRTGTPRPKELSQVTGTISVMAGSSQGQRLAKAANASDTRLPWRWQAHLDSDEEDLLRQVAEQETDYTLVADIILARTQRYYPNIASAFSLGAPLPVAWVWDKRMDDSAMAAMLDFFAQQVDVGTLARLHEKYFGHVQQFDYVDTRTFLSRIESLLPRYQPLFERHAGELDWRLLAAISYQESHWDPKAQSYTGVRGMMMLTEDTAKLVGVDNRLDAEQSIRGGAQYLSSLMTRLPESIPEAERIWFAMAAYNIGLGHVLDVRRLTQQLGQNPDAWAEVKENLPLLHQPKWYNQTRYGYARGRETKQFVNNIRQYYQSLLWQDNAQTDARISLESPVKTSKDSQLSAQAQENVARAPSVKNTSAPQAKPASANTLSLSEEIVAD
ncbi:membrane-bound lytic murein transglycosylase MltF [Oceanisphaera avium]|uniref:Membrane-bound lytic murein transglycosylase F n=1 Tax=Oceanisphaera avium TaxID=1903694 RepID=A0A1Y0CU05_9GAMM|nr:membrane-bound lytic murein transglycosylase MltF [Oceanisphaera avium]ART78762.1 lytic transglycosylase F [Oceanisphaera avium]